MKKKTIQNIILSLIFLLLTSTAAQSADWEKLGQRTVKRTKKAEVISLKTETPFKALKLSIGTVGVFIRNVTIYFADSEKRTVAINKAISPKNDTQIINLPENKQAISKVMFTYTTQKRSIVTLWATTKAGKTEKSSSK